LTDNRNKENWIYFSNSWIYSIEVLSFDHVIALHQQQRDKSAYCMHFTFAYYNQQHIILPLVLSCAVNNYVKPLLKQSQPVTSLELWMQSLWHWQYANEICYGSSLHLLTVECLSQSMSFALINRSWFCVRLVTRR